MRTLKRIILLTLSIIVSAVLLSNDCYAHDKKEHNQDLEEVLFGYDYKVSSQSDAVKNKIKIIEAAAYLSIDQFNGNGREELALLNREGILGIPKDISEIDFSHNSLHRSFTHRGWDFTYPIDKAHWRTRKKILVETVNNQIDFKSDSNGLVGYDKKCDALCQLIYYTHIIGDRIEDKSFNGAAVERLLGGEKSGEDIIDDLLNIFPVLFESQRFTPRYLWLTFKLNEYNSKLRKIGSNPQKEDYEEYHSYAIKLMDTLKSNVPELLADEEYFKTAFELE